jgi:hypothetical protein
MIKEYRGGIQVQDYKLVDEGEGNGFSKRSTGCGVMNGFEAHAHNGLVQLDIETISFGGVLSLGDCERFILTCEEVDDLIDYLNSAKEEAYSDQCELREKNQNA